MSAAPNLQPSSSTFSATAIPLDNGRNLVLCFDGTTNQFGNMNTNVVKLFGMLTKNLSNKQRVYYQTGIGTYTETAKDLLISKVAMGHDAMFATSLDDHVLGGYKFLMDNYEDGDQIFMYGFSRGAYTARVLAAMLYLVGLLPQDNEEHVPFAWSIFENAHKEVTFAENDTKRWMSLNFKRTFCREVNVEFLGLWDTVASVGLVNTYLEHTNYNPIVHYVRHAMALDETRTKFPVYQWGRPDEGHSVDFREAPPKPEEGQVSALAPAARAGGNSASKASLKKRGGTRMMSVANKNPAIRYTTNVEEVWFAGFHSDVGGGEVSFTEDISMANIPLRWMVRETLKHTDVLFEDLVLEDYNIATYEEMMKSDAKVDMDHYQNIEEADANAESHSPYKTGAMSYLYRVLEWTALPVYTTIRPSAGSVQDATSSLDFKINAYKNRDISSPGYPLKLHSSVLTRLNKLGLDAKKITLSQLPNIWGSPQPALIVDPWALKQGQMTGGPYNKYFTIATAPTTRTPPTSR